MTAADLIAAEEKISELWRAGEINALTHLSGSVDRKYEEWLCQFFRDNIKETDWVCVGHRHHYHALLHGMPMDELIANILRGKSMFNYASKFICSAIVGGTAGIAAGLALAAKQRGTDDRVFCFCGDGCEDQGAFSEAVWFVHERKLPCTFIIEDNDSSCGVSREQRRGSNVDRPWPECVVRVHYKPRWPHAGDGSRPELKSKIPAA